MPDPKYRNVDYSDRELLINVYAVARDVGATTAEIAVKLGITANGKKGITPSKKIGSRLGWMRTFGFLARVKAERGKEPVWLVTEAGQLLIQGQLSKAVQTALDKMDDGSQLLLMRALTRRAYVEASQETATAIRREYQHQVAQRVR